MRWLALALLSLTVVAKAEGLSPTASATPVWKDSGVEYCLGAAALSVFNGGPLSYTPFELGWRFSNGAHIRSGIDIFYYEGLDTNAKEEAQGVRNYSYDMLDWRTSLLYTIPVPGHLRPLTGLTFDVLSGTRKLAGPGVLNPPVLTAWGFLGAGAVLGGEWRANENWALEAQARYTLSFGAAGSVTALGLNGAYLF